MKRVFIGLLVAAGLALEQPASAQVVVVDSATDLPPEPLWKRSFKAGLNFTEATLSSNWRGGGVNSFGLNTLLNAKANYKLDAASWDNEADLLYAFVSNKGQGYRKNLDRIFLDTKYGRSLSPHWDTFVSLNLLTQFAAGYKYSKDANGNERAQILSSTFAPAYVTAAYGFEYHPTDYFKVRLSPFAPRLTIVGRNQRFMEALGDRPYGVRPGHSTRFEVLAAQVLAEFDKDIAKNVNLKARYLLFANYGDNFALRRIDHRLDAGLTAKVNRYINVALTGIMLYDYDQDRGLQYSQGLTLGFLYTIQNYSDDKK
ncbi:DUF3078 domain-containing protein [Hymenobacter jejuensis]|uniref:DUF3078 domain-containing protein n=1 Tax=Hymenobacter jejuensis TaxID=2502781 RepID=A0A5B7ZVQ7_9BACT|nr:DUF3078 domain-containing protein [Hymenobacter jejuensis]QDA58665.1 DUF3078 domain-containing protein [Hymenobacter jejuensis]